MSLLPIIYTSILIFTAFMLFVIFLSYVIYKAKSKNNVPVYLKHVDPLGNRLVPQPILINSNAIRQTIIAGSIPQRNKAIQLSAERIRNRQDEYTRAVQSIQNEKVSRRKNEQTQRNDNSARELINYKPKPISARIEVMNNSERYKTKFTNEEIKRTLSPNHYTNHGDVNLLTFYSDKSDLDLVTLSTPQATKAI
ncbi:MAG: hypothetical protein NTX65_17625 [Ignavibacteriales bacterium]|nr:hypothetical protein [Ignavibacteriales bacterium]